MPQEMAVCSVILCIYLDAMISHLEQELDDKELFRKVVQILADDETASDG